MVEVQKHDLHVHDLRHQESCLCIYFKVFNYTTHHEDILKGLKYDYQAINSKLMYQEFKEDISFVI